MGRVACSIEYASNRCSLLFYLILCLPIRKAERGNQTYAIEGINPVQEVTVPVLVSWENFYVIIGSAAAALTGLMFVAISLIASIRRRSSNAVNAYGTPTVVHFGAALLISALLSAPWTALWGIALLLGAVGLAGMVYIGVVLRRSQQQNEYQPVFEDWLFHFILPFVGYATLFICGILLPSIPAPVLFFVATAALLFLFIGIHNAWDTVTFVTLQYAPQEQAEQEVDANSRRSS